MASSSKDEAREAEQQRTRYTSTNIARIRNGSSVYPMTTAGASIKRHLGLSVTNAQMRQENRAFKLRVVACAVVLVLLLFLSLCPMGAAGQSYSHSHAYLTFSPLDVLYVLYLHVYQFLATTTHLFDEHTSSWLLENAPGYWAVEERAGIVAVTAICAVLLSVSGMLFQNVFKNPIAGPGMLGVSSGVSIGIIVLIAIYGNEAVNMLQQRYALCYGFGLLILVLVMGIGMWISRKGGSNNVMAMILVGMILSQLLGFITSYYTLFVLDTRDYLIFFNISQMLVIDTSPFTWICLGIASVVSLVPIYFLRYKMNGLAYGELEARVLGINLPVLRLVALACGSVMIIAAQIHTGMVGLVSLVVPFVSRGWFGCEFSRQLAGNVCLSGIFLLVCRDIVDLIPFVGDGIAIGSVVGFVALPIFLVLMARQTRGWE